uniref:Uncharacterized protein n=1 Tax=Tanacetum cinerariifolium TaxID=118510 RepID=A0A6L2JIN3_TANCI|nr:hypothetical protein [Tanacetum cinerariifolium]
MVGVDINTLTMEQYLELARGNHAPGVVKLEIKGNVNFEIKSQLMQELRDDTSLGTRMRMLMSMLNESRISLAYSTFLEYHKTRVIFGIKPICDFSHIRAAKRWVDRLTQESSTPGNSLKMPLSKGPILGMTPAQALTTIQTMADHSQKWHDSSSGWNIGSNNNVDGLSVIDAKPAEDLTSIKNALSTRKSRGGRCKIEQLTKELHAKTTSEVPNSSTRWRQRLWVFDLYKSDLCLSFVEGLIAKGLEPSRGRFPYWPHVKRKLTPGSLTSRATRAKTYSSKDNAPYLTMSDDDEGLPIVLELQDATTCHLKIYAITPLAWKNHLDNHMDMELLDLHDHCYARQAVIENVVNNLSLALRENISTLSTEVKEHKVSLDRMTLESQKRADYQDSLSTLESKVIFLEAEKARLEVIEVSLQKEVEDLKHDRREVVLKVVPYAVMKLLHSDDMGSLVGKLVSSANLYGRCIAYEQVANMNEPFDLSKKATSSSVPVSNLMSPPADVSAVKP